MSRVLKKTVQQGRSDLSLIRGGWDSPNCARPTRAFGGRALREHGDRPSYPALFFSILLEIQIEELIIFGRKIQAGPVAGETCNDATMLLAKP